MSVRGEAERPDPQSPRVGKLCTAIPAILSMRSAKNCIEIACHSPNFPLPHPASFLSAPGGLLSERFLGNSPCKPPPHRTPPGAADLGLEQLSFEDNGCVLQILHWLRCSSGVGIKLVVTPLPLQLLPMRELCTQEPSDQCGLKNMS